MLDKLKRLLKGAHCNGQGVPGKARSPLEQDLEVYDLKIMADTLENWGEDNVWREIEYFLVGRDGSVLDIGCGTGAVLRRLESNLGLRAHGCDITQSLLDRARASGIPEERLFQCDATALPYANDQFDYCYSIGCLEHFTEEGIERAVAECARVSRRLSFHMVPVSRSETDEGWMKTLQSFHNNSMSWWLKKFQSCHGKIYVLPSSWNDSDSLGKWFVCGAKDV